MVPEFEFICIGPVSENAPFSLMHLTLNFPVRAGPDVYTFLSKVISDFVDDLATLTSAVVSFETSLSILIS
jgi:hypothetical protein